MNGLLVVLGLLGGMLVTIAAGALFYNAAPLTTFVIAYTNEKGDFEVLKHSAQRYTMNFGCATFNNMSTVCRVIVITPEIAE